MLSYKIFSSFDENCYKDWKEISHKGNYNFFQSFDFLKKIRSQNKNSLKIISIYYNNKIIMFAPLEIKRYLIFNFLQWIGTEISDYCNPIIINDIDNYLHEKEFKKIWKDILNNIGKFDLILLNNQPSKINGFNNPFTKYLKSIEISKIYQIKLDSSSEDYYKNLKLRDKKKFYEIQRTINKYKNLQKETNVIFEVINLPNDEIDFKKVIENKVYQLSKKGVKNKLNSEFVEIFKDLIKQSKKKYVLASLKVNDEIISTCIGITSNNVFYYYIPMIISEKYNNFKPGKILTLQIIEWCFKNNIKCFDFGLGDEKYKENFSNYSIPIHRYIFGKNFLGKILISILKIIFYKKKFDS